MEIDASNVFFSLRPFWGPQTLTRQGPTGRPCRKIPAAKVNWVTATWSALIGACAAMALPHLLLGIWQRRSAHLFFVLAATAVIGIAIGELSMMRAGSAAE